MARQAQAVQHVALVTTDPPATRVRPVMTDTPGAHAPHATIVRLVTTAEHALCATTVHLAQIAPIVLLEMNTHSAMAAPFAKAATWTPRVSSTVRFVRREMSAVTSAPFAKTARFVTIVHLVTIDLLVDRAPLVTTAHRAIRISTPVVTSAANRSFLRTM